MNFSTFINNAALLLALSVLSVHFRYLWLKKHNARDVVIGVLYGSFAIMAMTVPMELTEGAIFDGRSIILGLAGLFEPPIVVIIAATLSGAYRAYLGGIGMYIGIGSIVISSLIGIIFRAIVKRKKCAITFINLLILGLIIHVTLVLWFFAFPKEITLEIMNTIAVPYVTIFSLTTMLIGLFMHSQQQRLRVEQELAESEQKYRQLVETLQEGIWKIDKRAATTFVNPSMAEMLGYSVAEMLGKSLLDFIDKNDHIKIEGYLERREQGIKERYESVFIHKDGRRVYTIVAASPVFDRDGLYAGSLAGIQDITDRKKIERELERYSKDLERMVEERTTALKDAQGQLIAAEKLSTLGEMAASVGHELRNPLSVIRNAAYLLRTYSRGDKKLEEYVNLIDTESRNAAQIVSDLLDYSRIHPMKSDIIEISQLVNQVLEKEPLPENIAVEIVLSEELPKVLGNTQQLSQIMLNLIKNASEAMPKGGKITISTSVKDKRVGIMVKDTGEGISKESMPRLFEPLFTTKERGIGLGLAISRRLAELNEAEIGVKSQPGKGSAFTLWLKVA